MPISLDLKSRFCYQLLLTDSHLTMYDCQTAHNSYRPADKDAVLCSIQLS
jgi:hypothetical protein